MLLDFFAEGALGTSETAAAMGAALGAAAVGAAGLGAGGGLLAGCT